MVRVFSGLALVLLIALGCASRFGESAAPEAARTGGRVLAQYEGDDAGEGPATRALLRRAHLTIADVSDVPAAVDTLKSIATETGGYVGNTEIAKEGSSRVTLHVASDRLDSALDRIAALGTVEHRSVSSTDVTEKLADLDARLINQTVLRDRLRALLDRAKEVSDVLEIERELTRTQTEVDRLTGLLRRLRSQVALAEIHVTLKATSTAIRGPIVLVFDTLAWVVGKLFWVRQ